MNLIRHHAHLKPLGLKERERGRVIMIHPTKCCSSRTPSLNTKRTLKDQPPARKVHIQNAKSFPGPTEKRRACNKRFIMDFLNSKFIKYFRLNLAKKYQKVLRFEIVSHFIPPCTVIGLLL